MKTFGQSVFSFKRFKASIDQYQKWVIAYTIDLRRPMTLYTTFVNASFAVLIALTLIVVKNGTYSPEFLMNLLYYIIVTPVIAVTLNRLMFASENEMIVANELVLKDVRFKYPEASRFAVDGISLAVGPGQKIALVGPSGGGKTTTASLMARFFDVTEGAITLGGVDIRHIRKKDLMDRVSFVFQDSRLLKTSILENVRLGRPEATRGEVLDALHRAQCDDIIAKLPQGIDTVIGTKGTYLSGGEQQRVAIARAFLKDAPIILLDEATASLDVENEPFIQESLSRLVKDKTVIIIAHRMRTVAGADKIVVLKEGKVDECGSPSELTASGGFYKRMQDLQRNALEWNI